MLDRDQNLLFGIIAIQLRMATPARFIDIAAAWSIEPARSIPDRMVEAGVLTPEKRQLIDRLVEEALRHHQGDAKATFGTFGGDARLSEIVLSAALPEEEGQRLSTRLGIPLEFDTVDSSAVRAVTEDPGRYTRKGEFSRGGMGRILLVHDAFLSRDVALKELLPDFMQPSDPGDPKSPMRQSAALVVRFLREARITGQLEHPSIVPVYELGRRPDGGLYYTMKLVRGRTLSKALKECYSIEQRLRLLPHFMDLCQAIAYAHHRDIVHRDIKPSNTMIGEFGETVVIDWGLAKVVGREDPYEDELRATITRFRKSDSDQTPDGHTQEGERLGTPDYMAPEQALGQIEDVDPRSDVFSLGSVLYEILTGRPPFRAQSTDAVIYNVIVKEPDPIAGLEPGVPPELIGICVKALKKPKAERYASARELADDLEKFQAGALVGAYRYTSWELAKRFYRRHRATLTTAAAAAVVLLGFGVYSYLNILRANQSERHQRREADEARGIAESIAYVSQIRLAQAYIEDNNHALAKQTLMDTAVARRNWEWGYLINKCTQEKFTFAGFSGASYSEDGKMIATVSKTEPITIWDAGTGTKRNEITQQIQYVFETSFSPDNTRLAGCAIGGSIRVWDISTGAVLATMRGHTETTDICRFLPGGQRVVSASKDDTVRIWDASTGAELLKFSSHTGDVGPIAVNLDGSRILSVAIQPREVYLWDSATGQVVLSLKGSFADFSADGQRIVTVDGAAGAIWDAAGGAQIATLAQGPTDHERVLLNPNGTQAVTLDSDGVMRIYDASSGQKSFDLRGPETTQGLSFSRDGTRLLTWSLDDRARLWDTQTGRMSAEVGGHQGGMRAAVFSPKGGDFYTASFEPSVKLWDLGTDIQFEVDEPIVGFAGPVNSGRVAVLTGLGMHYVLDLSHRETVAAFEGFGLETKTPMALSRDGRRIAAAFDGFTTIVIDVEHRAILSSFMGHQGEVRDVAFSPDGVTIATASWDHTVAQWNAETGVEVRRYTGHADDVNTVAFNPDGTKLAAGSEDGTVRLWDVGTGALLHVLAGHEAPVLDVNFSADGARLVSASSDMSARIWDSQSGTLVEALKGHSNAVASAVFSPDGSRVVTSEEGASAKLWQVSNGQELITLTRENGFCLGLGFDSTGQNLLAGTSDGSVLALEAAPWRTGDLPGEAAQSWDERFALHRSSQSAHVAPAWIDGDTVSLVIVTAQDILVERLTRLRDALAAPEATAALSAAGGLPLGPSPALDALKRLCLREGDRISRINGTPLADTVAAVNALDAAIAGARAVPPGPVSFELLRGETHFLAMILTLQREERTVEVKITRERATEILDEQLDGLKDTPVANYRAWASTIGEISPSTDADAVPFIRVSSRNSIQDQYVAESGMAPNDRIIKVDGGPVTRLSGFVAVQTRLDEEVEAGRPVRVEYEIDRGEFQRLRLAISVE